MDIQIVGAWGELLGGVSGIIAAIGVIATLLYLARQIHQNTKSVQSSNFGTWIDATNALHPLLMQSTDFLEDALNDSRELTPSEWWSFHFGAVQAFYAWEAVFLFHKNGTVDDEYFESRMRTVQRTLRDRPGYKKWWNDWAVDLYDRRFVDYVNGMTGAN